MASSGRPDIGISAIPYAPIRQIRQNSSLPRLYPKSPSTVPFLSNFFSKNFVSPLLTIAKTPQKGHTLSELFFKKFYLLPGLFPKHPPVALLLLRKNQKFFSTPLTIKIAPLFCHTLFQLFSKKFYSSTVDYHFFLLFVSPPILLF